jgi:hypothetical protein
MTLTVNAYLRAWERVDAGSALLNRRLVPGGCVLETLSLAIRPGQRFVFMDDFGYAASYCRQRLREDLTPPVDCDLATRERWWTMRGAFATKELSDAWAAADAALTRLLADFTAHGYTPALASRLRAIVNKYSLDLEIGAIYVMPDDLPKLLTRKGALTSTRATARSSAPQPFDFANARRRAALARWLRAANQPA